MDSSDDEEERLRQWKQHLASQQTDDEEDGPPPAELLSSRRGESSSGRSHSARRRAERELPGSHASAPRDSLDVAAREKISGFKNVATAVMAGGDGIDWKTAMMPQMRQLQHENEKLQARLKEQERMISRLQQQNDLNNSYGGEDGAPVDQKESKIVELAKKNRALTLALDKEKAKSGRFAADLKRVQQELEAATKAREGPLSAFAGMDARSLPKEAAKAAKDGKPGAALAFGRAIEQTDAIPENDQTPEDKVKELQTKLAVLNGQVNSQRLANERLKQENGKVKEALKRELGDVPLDSALRALEGAAGGGWTGRAQTISLLQSKIVELKRELAASLHSKLSPGSSPSREAAANGLSLASPHKPAVVTLDAASRLDAQHREQVYSVYLLH